VQLGFDRQFEEFGTLANFIFYAVVNFVIVSLPIEKSCLAFLSAD
jgi:hypothetical protein